MAQEENANVSFPPPFPPGLVVSYNLPIDGVEEPFEPITWCATDELGHHGPLNPEKLREFLKKKIDGRYKGRKLKDILQEFKEFIPPARYDVFYMQLTTLRSRINQIITSEKDKTDEFCRRVKSIEDILSAKKFKAIPALKFELSLSGVTRKALQEALLQGPLTDENVLKRFINSGSYDPNVTRLQLRNQLKNLRLNIIDNTHFERHAVQFTYDKILKALRDIIDEMQSF